MPASRARGRSARRPASVSATTPAAPEPSTACQPASASASAAATERKRPRVPQSIGRRKSATRSTVRSRSSWKLRTWSAPLRAVAAASRWRGSSPSVNGRISRISWPWPRLRVGAMPGRSASAPAGRAATAASAISASALTVVAAASPGPDMGERPRDDVARGDAVGGRPPARHQPVRQRVGGEILDVLGQRVVAAAERGARPRGGGERQRAAGRDGVLDEARRAASPRLRA